MSAREDELLELSVVAKKLKRCPETIRRYIRRGLLHAVRIPPRHGNYLISESSLQKFLTTPYNN